MTAKEQPGPIEDVRSICETEGRGIQLLELLSLPSEAGGGYMAILQVPEGVSSTGPEVRELSTRLQEVNGLTRVVVNLYP